MNKRGKIHIAKDAYIRRDFKDELPFIYKVQLIHRVYNKLDIGFHVHALRFGGTRTIETVKPSFHSTAGRATVLISAVSVITITLEDSSISTSIQTCFSNY